MKILLLGKDGQVGWELQRSLSSVGELVALGRAEKGWCGDIGDAEGMARTIEGVAPDVIVNAAAYTAVDKAETERAQAMLINAGGPERLAQEAKKRGALLVHYSTDYVFDGSGEAPWRETDDTGPLNVYGQSKLEGERAIAASGCRHLIFRSSWIYGARGDNFAKTMLRLAKERDRLSVIDDQFGAPTGADLVADITAHAIRVAASTEGVDGVYHLAAAGETCWYDYARFVLDHARRAGVAMKAGEDAVLPIAARDFLTAARRPANSRLDTVKVRGVFGVSLPEWQAGVLRMLAEILV